MEILELKNKIAKVKYSLGGLNSRMEVTEEKVSELEGKSIEFIQSEPQREK